MRIQQQALRVLWMLAREFVFYFGSFPERRPNNMDTNLLVRVVAGVLVVVVAAIIIARRKKNA
jgi:hypothetical protein